MDLSIGQQLCRIQAMNDHEENQYEPVEEEEDADELSELEGAEDSAPVIRMRIITDKGQELLRIDKFLMGRVEGATRNKIQQAIDDGFVTVNGHAIKPNYKVRPGDDIVLMETRRPESSEIVPEEMALDIVYEDEHMLIINKPAGIVVHPGSGNYSGTLVNGLAWYLSNGTATAQTLPRIGLVHRIDKDTSGLLVIGKTEDALMKLAAQFKRHKAHRRYTALAWGDFDEDEGTVVAHVGRHQRFRKIMAAYKDGEHGKEAITHYSVLERFGYVTLLELRLETGRTHQIRVHMQSIGHALFNDATYGGDRILKGTIYQKYKQFVDNCFGLLPRQALHARELGLRHPATNEWMQWESPLPPDMVAVVEKWRVYTKARRLEE